MARSRRKLAVTLVALDLVSTLVARRRGYGVGGNAIVRCRRGHLFTTLWLPLVSLKALRLGWWRVQRCPVGHHWSIVTPVKETGLSRLDRRRAQAHHDVWLP